MKEKPILFSSPMVRAILKGQKTQTRRVMKPQPIPAIAGLGLQYANIAGTNQWALPDPKDPNAPHWPTARHCPYGTLGDRLWVREAFSYEHGDGIAYRATNPELNGASWKPSIHMPRRASRLDLEILDVRVERLQDITEEDAKVEGVALPDCNYIGRCNSTRCPRHADDAYRQALAMAWDAINGERAPWASNPWVWVVEFKRVAS